MGDDLMNYHRVIEIGVCAICCRRIGWIDPAPIRGWVHLFTESEAPCVKPDHEPVASDA